MTPAGNKWELTRASEPAITKDDAPTSTALKDAQAMALGTGQFNLVSAGAFQPETHRGRKVEARGLLYRDSKYSLLNLTSLDDAGGNCER
jgi:hypothetical protein